MPTYEYRCEQGHTFEVLQRMSDDPLTTCTSCDSSVRRVMHPVAVHFKGSGFYHTDYGKRGRPEGAEGSDKGEKADKKADGDGSSERAKGSESGGASAGGGEPGGGGSEGGSSSDD